MERLYISDLDGTLLTPEKTISPRTREAVNRAIAAGEGFSVATARSASTVVEILQGIQLNLPVVLMNGVFLYDIAADRYLDVQTIPLEAAQRMLEEARTNAEAQARQMMAQAEAQAAQQTQQVLDQAAQAQNT